MPELALGGDTFLLASCQRIWIFPSHIFAFCFSLVRIFSSNYLFINLSFFFLLLTEVSVSYFNFLPSFLPSHFLICTSICQTPQQWLKYAKWYFLISIHELWSRNLPSLTEAFLCKAHVWFQFLMDRVSFWRKCAKSGISIKNIFLLFLSEAKQTNLSKWGRKGGRKGSAKFLVRGDLIFLSYKPLKRGF